MKKQNKIIGIIGTVTFVTLLAKVLGFVREALQAREFGMSGTTDLFTLSYNSTTYIFTTVAYALCIAALPVISKKLAKSRDDGIAAANNILCICLSLSALVMAFGLIFPKIYLGTALAGLSDELASKLILYTRILLPGILLIVATYVFLSLLQSLEHYYLQGSLSLPANVVLIIYLIVFGDRFGMAGLVTAISLSWLLQLAMTFPALSKEKYRFAFRIDFRADYIADFAKTALATVFNTSVFLICYLSDTSAAKTLGEGNATAFYYADKLFSPLTSTLIYSISTVMFPKFNLEYNRTSDGEYKSYVKNIIEKTVMIMLPVSVIFSAVTEQVIDVVFGGGSFDDGSVVMTAGVLCAYALGMTGFGVLDLLNKAFYTMGKAASPLIVNVAIVLLNLGLDFVLVRSGGFFVALCTSVSLSLGAVIMAVVFFKGVDAKTSLLKILKSIAAAAIMAALLFALRTVFLNVTDAAPIQIVKSVALGALGVLLYFALLALFGEREIVGFFFSKFKRERSEK